MNRAAVTGGVRRFSGKESFAMQRPGQRLDAVFKQLLRRAKTGHTGPDNDNQKFHSNRIFSHNPIHPCKSAHLDFDPDAGSCYLISMNSSPIDWEQLNMIADGFPPDFVEIYREYLAGIPGLLNGLRQKIRENDAAQAARIAHQIKGSSANFGFIGISEPIASLERDAKGGSLANASIHLNNAENGFSQAVAEVKARQGI